MAADRLTAVLVIEAAPDAVFDILAQPLMHAAIDGTGWVCAAMDTEPLTAPGQVFRMAMYHPDHPDGRYQVANRVELFDPPRAISWMPGYDESDGSLGFGGWVWRYDVEPAGPGATRVTLTYDWSAVSDEVRERIGFPPFAADHLKNSLEHLAELMTV